MKLKLLNDKTVAIVGCGGLGTNVAVHMVCMGIGTIKLYDFDTVNKSNLDRQFMFSVSDCGKMKTAVLGSRLKEISPECKIECFNEKVNLQTHFDADIVFSCVDNGETRAVLNSYCRKNMNPLINGGIDSSVGIVYAYIPGKTADLQKAGLLNDIKSPVSISSTVGITGALMTEECVKILSGDMSDAGMLIVYENAEISKMLINKP